MGLFTDKISPQLEPEVYKTRKDENFTEYFKVDIYRWFSSFWLKTKSLFQVGKNKSYTKVAEGPHFVSESKEVQQQEDRQVRISNWYDRNQEACQHPNIEE